MADRVKASKNRAGWNGRHVCSAIAIGWAISFAATSASAQGSAATESSAAETDGQSIGSNTIIVTATRREESLIETPTSITVVNVQEAITNGITDINGLADLVPNLQAADGGSPGLGNLVIRGVYAGGAPTTGIFIDDVPYGPVIGGAGSSLAFDGSLFDLERIEVLRGPQGTLFGSSSMGGTVRYVTAQPSLSEFGGFVSGDLSFTKDGETNTRLRGRISAPVVKDTLAVSVAGYVEDAGGYIDHPLRNARNVNDSKFWGLQGQVLFTPTDKLEIRLHALHQQADFENAGFVAFDPATGEPLLGDLTDIAADVSPRTLNTDIYSGSIEYDFGFAKLKSITSFQNIVLNNLTDLTAAFGPLVDFLSPGTAPNTVSFLSGFDTDRFTQELRLTSRDSERFEYVVGAYYTKQKTSSVQIATPAPADLVLLDADLQNEYEEIAGFANGTFYMTPDWDITLGIRVSHYEDTINSVLTGSPFLIGAGPFPSGTQNKDTFVSYQFNTRYRVSPSLNLYARAANGFRPGGANLVFQVAGTTIGNPSYVTDSLWSYEFGAKGELFGGDATYDIGVFYLDWQDTQLTTVANGIGVITNANDGVTAWGLEAAFGGEVAPGLNLSATFGYIRSELDGDNPVLGALEGESLEGTPDFTASLVGDYRFDIGGVPANLGTTIRWTGNTPISYRGGIGQGGAAITPINPFFENDPFAQVDLRAGVDLDPVKILFYVTNLTNSDAYQSVFTVSPAAYQGTIIRPRTFGVNLRMDF